MVYTIPVSLFAIPFLIFLRSLRSAGFKQMAFKVLSSPAGILSIPTFFILITQVLLRPYFPEETHALINDWAYFILYFCFFIFGMLCYSTQALWESIGRNRTHLLISMILVLIPFYVFFFHFRELIHLPWSVDAIEIAFDVTAVFVSWVAVITVIAYGQHYLNKPHLWLGKINEGLYPFYILHQTVIILLGYYICQLSWSISAKFWCVSLLTLVSCIVFYWLFIRNFNPMRFLFGMKPMKE